MRTGDTCPGRRGEAEDEAPTSAVEPCIVRSHGRVLNDDSLPLRSRAAAALVLLYAQRVTRIIRLAVDDGTDDGTTVTVGLGDPPSQLPEPIADLMRVSTGSTEGLGGAGLTVLHSAAGPALGKALQY
ncbi:hypothetical protein AB0K74_19045 [Streptomyces sp. NPDC056159]|uniref:hypothetical protein n=1 Tax=unclassified Streptomyces TaxID=2593676 RepID=UPI0034245210